MQHSTQLAIVLLFCLQGVALAQVPTQPPTGKGQVPTSSQPAVDDYYRKFFKTVVLPEIEASAKALGVGGTRSQYDKLLGTEPAEDVATLRSRLSEQAKQGHIEQWTAMLKGFREMRDMSAKGSGAGGNIAQKTIASSVRLANALIPKLEEEIGLLGGNEKRKPRNQDAVIPDISADGKGTPKTITPEIKAPTASSDASKPASPTPRAGPLDPTKVGDLRLDDPARVEKYRQQIEAAYPNLVNSEWEVTKPHLNKKEHASFVNKGVEPPNCLSHVLGFKDRGLALTEGDTARSNTPVALDPYTTLDTIFSSSKGYDKRGKFRDGVDYPTGSILVYEGPVWWRDQPRHVAILNVEGRWESVLYPGGPLITHSKPSAVAGDKSGQPRYIYTPKKPK